MPDDAPDPDLAPYPDLSADERTTLVQFLELYRWRVVRSLQRLGDEQARARPLPATDLTPGGIVKHLAHMEDHWFTARVGGRDLPEPWASAPADQPDWDFRSAAADDGAEIIALYRAACERSRQVVRELPDLDALAPRPSFGRGPVSLRWTLVHLIEETACHAGHLDLLVDAS
ncbi:MAG TPA: DinB family protein [Microlunatus sp.]|nr:DinB family protein [Microlunatus sp.]